MVEFFIADEKFMANLVSFLVHLEEKDTTWNNTRA